MPKRLALADLVRCDDLIYVLLTDGRLVTYPLTERLQSATPEQRRNCRVEDFGTALHWPDADEDLGLNTILGVSEDEMDDFAEALWRKEDRSKRRARRKGAPSARARA